MGYTALSQILDQNVNVNIRLTTVTIFASVSHSNDETRQTKLIEIN